MTNHIHKTNSTFGNWAVRVDNATIKFFWRKADAVKYVDSIREYLDAKEDAENDIASLGA